MSENKVIGIIEKSRAGEEMPDELVDAQIKEKDKEEKEKSPNGKDSYKRGILVCSGSQF